MKKLFPLLMLCFSVRLIGQTAEIKHPLLQNIQYKKLSSPLPISSWDGIIQKIFRFSNATSWKKIGTVSDQIGQTHYRFQQYFKGIPVFSGIGIAHTQSAEIISFNGDFIPESKLAGSKKISISEALEIAKSTLPSSLYGWLDTGFIQTIQKVHGPDSFYQPFSGLTYCPKNFNITDVHRLAYKFIIYSSIPVDGKTVFIDAENGDILGTEDLVLHTDVKGTAVTKYSGNRQFTTDSVSPGVYRLRNKAYGNGIETYNMKKTTSYGGAVDFTDADNYWNNVNANKDEIATDAHWGAEVTYNYYKSVFNRNSYDGNGAKILSYVHYSTSYDNAFWNGVCMTYGDGNTFKPLTALDVCGHEITHAVTSNTAALVYSYESGALNESFSDVFGNTIEWYGRPTQWGWKIGEDITTSGNGLRNMSNPNIFGHPKFYKGNYWYTGAGDNGGVHTNSGVQNYWYYLITEGITGTNEKGWSFTIDSLGFDKAGAIAYRNLSVYLTKNAQYADARTYSIMSAADLYGQCSKEVIAVTNAWWVCGVGNKYDSGYVKANFKGDTMACFTGKSLSFSNLSDNYKTCVWNFGDGNTSTSINPTHAYSSYGVFNVKLTVTSCFLNKKDSITKSSFVKVDSNFDICKSVIMPKSGTDSATRCWGFVYDNGGEGNYVALVQSNLKLYVPAADSIRYRFLYLDYENGYDSVVLFHTNLSWANKIGRFTGSTTPFTGSWRTVNSNTLWFRHYSDPFVEGRGFKVEFIAYRKPLAVDLPKDSTFCDGQVFNLSPSVTGGYAPNYYYTWQDGSHTNNKILNPVADGKYKVMVKDACTLATAEDSMQIVVRKPLKVTLNKDTVICNGRSVQIKATATGGKPSAYYYAWTPANANVSSFTVTPGNTSTYKVKLTDGCSVNPDSASVTVYVKPKLAVKLTAGATHACIGKSISLGTNGSGGDTANYMYSWNQGLGTGTSKNITLNDTQKVVVTLQDGCSVQAAKDSLTLYTWPAIRGIRTPDTTACIGSTVNLYSKGSGGNGTALQYAWNSGQSTSSINFNATTAKYYVFTISDNCSPVYKDSIKLSLLNPLSLSKPLDTVLCDGQTYNVTVTDNGGRNGSRNISWNPGGWNGNNQILNPTVGTHNFVLVLSDGCTVKNDTQKFTVQKLAPLSISFNLNPNNICEGDSAQIQFSATGGKTAKYAWTMNGNPILIQKYKVGPVNNTNYTLQLQDACSPSATDSKSLIVNPSPSITLASDIKEVCVKNPVNFSFSSSNVAAVMWYLGNKDSMAGVASGTPYIYTKSGTYSISAKAITTTGCMGNFTAPFKITAYDYPIAAITANPTITDIDHADIQFNDASTGGTGNYWAFGDGNQASNVASVLHTYTDTGRYKAYLISTVGPSCSDTAEIKIRIKDIYKIFIPNTFTPDINGKNDIFIPAGRGISKMEIKIFNRWGQKVFESKDMNKGWDGTLPNGGVADIGVYTVFITVLDTENFRHTEKTVVHLLR